ncbi:Uu.00g033690.m01.CDS01 [Anthostomella pinea]|uniref:Uu.00g033690.m01.CDS01 n=1 Tax=Anthostomella pinea TaxID=933095 RepID=A0AAI8V9X8_9PEZI|nr:Uu.00g033690.m01.CDS01 [Anthostomella pinea]
MRPARHALPPSSSLPALRSLDVLTEEQVLAALGNLYALYCPLPPSLAFQPHARFKESPFPDSGYTSGNEEDEGKDGVKDAEEENDSLRDDAFERSFAERWLTGFIGCAEELSCFSNEDVRQRAIDRASCVLASFYPSAADEDDEDIQITREFHFTLVPDAARAEEVPINVCVTDGLAGRDVSDHTDVGLQSWGAAIVFSELMCASPSRLGITQDALGSAPRIIELGAGTGLVSLVLGKMLPHVGITDSTVVATDYHSAVLANLTSNIAANFPSKDRLPIQTSLLDWSAPDLAPPLDVPADMLVATDVVYEPKHAVWLRDCAARLLAPDGVFWLVATVRRTGRFEGISDTVRGAFTSRDGVKDEAGRVLAVLHEERLEKKRGIGRGDESEYKLFRIGWA